MDYRFYQGLVMRQAKKGQDPEAGFSEFMGELIMEYGDKTTGGMRKLQAILFPARGGGISEECEILELIELINPEKFIPIMELLALSEEAENENGGDAGARLMTKLGDLQVPEEKFVEVCGLLDELRQGAERGSQFEEKKSELIQAMWLEQAEIFKKYIGLFAEAFK